MAEVLGLGMSHYPVMMGAGGGRSISYRLVDRPDLPPEAKDPANWPAAMRAELVGALRGLLPELAVHDLTGINAARPARGWGAELPLAAVAAARIPNAYVRIAPGEVQVDGSVRDAQHREEVALELVSLAGEHVKVILRLNEPLVVVAPYVLAAVKDIAGGFRLETCAARDAEEQARLQAALNRLGIATGEARCPVALGGPSGDWAAAAEAGLDALSALPAGRFRLEYRSAELIGQAPTAAPEFESALAGLPPLEREIVVARIWGRLSFAQIAELVEQSSSAVHRRYKRALAELRTVLNRQLSEADR